MRVRTPARGAPPQDTLLPSVQKRRKQPASPCCPRWGRHLPARAVCSLPRGASLPATPEDSDPSPGQRALGCSSRFGGWCVGGRTCLVSRPWVVPAVSGSCWVGCAVLLPGSLLFARVYSDYGSPGVPSPMSPGCFPWAHGWSRGGGWVSRPGSECPPVRCVLTLPSALKHPCFSPSSSPTPPVF